MVRYEYIRRLGYYCTESSEHNAEYNPLFIKSRYPELIEQFNIPLDEYPRRCINQIKGWKEEKESILKDGKVEHTRSSEYASYIMEAMVTGNPYKIGGNVLNTGLIDNLPADACVEVPCLVDKMGVNPCHVGRLPVQLAAMNMTNINAQLMTTEAARTRKREDIYRRRYAGSAHRSRAFHRRHREDVRRPHRGTRRIHGDVQITQRFPPLMLL